MHVGISAQKGFLLWIVAVVDKAFLCVLSNRNTAYWGLKNRARGNGEQERETTAEVISIDGNV